MLTVEEDVQLATWCRGVRAYLPHPERLRDNSPVPHAIRQSAQTTANSPCGELALKYKTAERHVYRVLAGEEDEADAGAITACDQPDLFCAD